MLVVGGVFVFLPPMKVVGMSGLLCLFMWLLVSSCGQLPVPRATYGERGDDSCHGSVHRGKWRGADRRGKGVNWVRLDATPQVLAR